MRAFLVEQYRSGVRAGELEELAARGRAAAEELTRRGTPVRLLRSYYLSGDETLFSVYEAATAELAELASRGAGIGCDRVVEATQLPVGQSH